MKKYLPHLLVALALIVVAGAGISYALASGNHRSDAVITKLAEKFNLDKSEVEQVFEENRVERRQQKQAQQQEMLEQAVKDGKITEEQKKMLTEKREELRTEMQDLSWDERREQRSKHRQEMQDWAEENGIDLDALCQFGKGKGMRGFGSGRK